ncbi:hypothetical protein [Gordonia sp. NPDC127522]|uniref:hypothetical protein n=1 Tax=Gordonia sp. NPDC127522 TaxID=3345390 RepID=UPI0036301421
MAPKQHSSHGPTSMADHLRWAATPSIELPRRRCPTLSLDSFLAAGARLIDTAVGDSSWVPGNSGGESETTFGAWIAARVNRATP